MNFNGRCELCNTDQRVSVSLVRWKIGDKVQYDNLPRCVDRAACRARVEARGEEWMVLVDDREGAA